MSRFTLGELRVMQLLWKHGELKPSRLQELYPEAIKNPAMRSYLSTLLAKGHVVRRKVGKAFLYKAITPEQKAFSTMLGDMVRTFFSGSIQELVMTLVEREKLDLNELKELQELAQSSSERQATKDTTPSKPSRKKTSRKRSSKRKSS